MANIPVSIVLLYYHRDPEKMPDNYDPFMMNDCVDAVLQHTNNFELIAVNNGSTVDESWLDEYADKHIHFDKNMGISYGWNTGIKNATHEHIIILSDDVVVSSGWVEAMFEAIQQPNAGMAGVHVEGLPMYEGIVENYRWFPAMNMMITKETVKRVGYFDYHTYFPCNFEDTDFEVRCLAHGLTLYVNYGVTVQHRGGATLHVPDLSGPFDKLKQKFIDKHGFDPIPYMYHGEDIQEVLHKANKKVVIF